MNQKKQITLISHFYNEEYLLPWWLKHHSKIFDNAILIDYHSTDRSVEIIKNLCPNWAIIKSRNENFEARLVDNEVMDIEKSIEGYKIVLNTTEFLVPIDKNSLLSNSLEESESCYSIPTAIIVDHDPNDSVSYEDNLIEKKNFGLFDFSFRQNRFIHNHSNGNYVLGRHFTNLPVSNNQIPFLIFWYGYAPWTEETIQRKLQIGNMVPDSDIKLGRGFQHRFTRNKMEEIYEMLKSQEINKLL